MLQDLTFGGSYKDENLIMEAMLLNPVEHGYNTDVLLFEILITSIRTDATELSEWDFYILDGQNRIHNAVDITELPTDDASKMTVLVSYQFRTEYLYEDIHLGFLYEPYCRIEFVEINH